MSGNASIVLVIGAAGGIGKEAVKGLLSQGYRVIAADRNREKLDTLRSRYAEIHQGNLSTLVLDMTQRAAVSDALSRIKSEYGALDAVVITAAVHSTYPVEYLPDEVVDRVLDVNLSAHIKLVRDCLSVMKDGGKVVGVSSIAAGVGIPMSSLYSASKAGLEMFYESLAAEVAYRNIKCVLIQPGNVNTGFNETGNEYQARGNAFVDEAYKRVIDKIDSRHGMGAREVAAVIVSAIESSSPKLCYVVGQNALKAHWAKRLLGRDGAFKLMKKHFGL